MTFLLVTPRPFHRVSKFRAGPEVVYALSHRFVVAVALLMHSWLMKSEWLRGTTPRALQGASFEMLPGCCISSQPP